MGGYMFIKCTSSTYWIVPLTLSLKEIYWKLGDSGSSTSCGMDGPRLRYLPSGRGRDGRIFGGDGILKMKYADR